MYPRPERRSFTSLNSSSSVVSLSMTELLAVLVLDSYIIEEVVGMQ